MTSRFMGILAGGIALLALCPASFGQAFTQTQRKPVFISPEQLDVTAILPSPPAAGSTQSLADLAELHRIQDTRTRAEIAHARIDEAESSIFSFADVMGEKFTRKALPLTALLSDHIRNDEGVIVNPGKEYFHRLRPYNLDHSLKPACKVSDPADYAHPSGHAAVGYLEALVLVMIAPEKRDAIFARADDYSHNRLVCGAHYPSDIAASKSVAYAMIGIIMSNPEFRKELDSAKTETRKALGL